jgi:hypothetical protein
MHTHTHTHTRTHTQHMRRVEQVVRSAMCAVPLVADDISKS